MDGPSKYIDLSIRSLNLTLLILVLWVIFYYGIEAYKRWKRGALYDLEQKEKAEAKRRASLSDDELIDEANKALGLPKRTKTSRTDS